MRGLRWPSTLVLAALLVGCAAPAGPAGGGSPSHASPSSGPTAGATATATVTAPALAGLPVTFPAADGTPLSGKVFGTGTTSVILSNMGDNDAGPWERFAPTLAASGYSVLTYSYRYPVRTPSFTADMAHGAVDDLRGAAAWVRSRGARRVVLVGASLGGMATAKVAGAAHADAVVILAAPAERAAFDLRVEASELAAITAPKLFVVADHDPTVPPAETRQLFDLAPQPKVWQSYPSAAHGTQLLDTGFAGPLRELLLTFIADLGLTGVS